MTLGGNEVIFNCLFKLDKKKQNYMVQYSVNIYSNNIESDVQMKKKVLILLMVKHWRDLEVKIHNWIIYNFLQSMADFQIFV